MLVRTIVAIAANAAMVTMTSILVFCKIISGSERRGRAKILSILPIKMKCSPNAENRQ
jgi:hypothetical protein